MSLVFFEVKYRESNITATQRIERWIYVVQMNDPDDTAIDACAAIGIDTDDEHPTDSRMTCTRIDAKFITDSAYVFDVTIEYSTATDSNTSSNPLELGPQVDGAGVEYSRIMGKDRLGRTMVNAAGDSFDPAPTEIIYDEEIRVVLPKTSIDAALFNQYRGAVNSDSFTIVYPDESERIFAAGICKMGNITYVWKTQNGVGFWEVAYPIMIRNPTDEDIGLQTPPRPWLRHILNEGYNEVVNGTKRPILINGQRTSAPQLLDSSGKRIATESFNWFNPATFPSAPVFMPAQDYIELPFGFLNLAGE